MINIFFDLFFESGSNNDSRNNIFEIGCNNNHRNSVFLKSTAITIIETLFLKKAAAIATVETIFFFENAQILLSSATLLKTKFEGV